MSTKPDTTLLERIRRSGLVSQDALLPLWQRLETRGVDLGSDKAVADALVEWEVLTDWQAEKLLEGKYKGFFLGSPELIAIIDRMMAQQPDERVQTAAEIAKLLATWLFEHGGDEWKRQHGQEFPPEPLFASLSCDDPFQRDS